MFKSLKKFAVGAAACLTAAFLFAGCTGGGGGGSKVANEDFPGHEVKLGTKTYKVMPVKNENNFSVPNSPRSCINAAAVGNVVFLQYETNSGTKIAKFTLDKNSLKLDNAEFVKKTSQGMQLASDGTYLYHTFGKNYRVKASEPDNKKEEDLADLRGVLVPTADGKTAYNFTKFSEIKRGAIENGKFVNPQKLVGEKEEREKAGIRAGDTNMHIVGSDMFIYGLCTVPNPKSPGKTMSVGVANRCDLDGKVQTTYAGIGDTSDTGYAASFSSINVYADTVLVHNGNNRNIISYDKKSGKANGKLEVGKFFNLKSSPNRMEFARLNDKRCVCFFTDKGVIQMYLIDEK